MRGSGFSVVGLNRLYGRCLKRTPASGRVREKIGMVPEGCLREHAKKWEHFEDIVRYGSLQSAGQNKTEQGRAGDSGSAPLHRCA